jgi:nucleoside 2-deoxyribosyltransferase
LKTVYLAGPILGLNYEQANDWRVALARELSTHHIRGVSPLRCEPLTDDVYTTGSDDPMFGTARAIASKNIYDIKNCDLTLCYQPSTQPLSVGTLMELAYAHALGKPTVFVAAGRLPDHPLVQHCSGWILPTLGDALELIVGLFSDYVR